MLKRRVVVCLDVDNGRVVKGTQFAGMRDVGDVVGLATRYEAEGADEIVFLDVSASIEARGTMLAVAQRAAQRLFIPLTIGGGVRDADDVARALRSGADKVSINTAAVERPALLSEAADRFGRQCVVASIDARRRPSGWEVYVRGGRQATGLDAVAWAVTCADLGAGEILLTSIDRDGTGAGYDLELTAAVSSAVTVPVIASGGARSVEHVSRVLVPDGGAADAALVAGMVHDRLVTIAEIKRRMAEDSIPVRWHCATAGNGDDHDA